MYVSTISILCSPLLNCYGLRYSYRSHNFSIKFMSESEALQFIRNPIAYIAYYVSKHQARPSHIYLPLEFQLLVACLRIRDPHWKLGGDNEADLSSQTLFVSSFRNTEPNRTNKYPDNQSEVTRLVREIDKNKKKISKL